MVLLTILHHYVSDVNIKKIREIGLLVICLHFLETGSFTPILTNTLVQLAVTMHQNIGGTV
jgi:hypothetical protein